MFYYLICAAVTWANAYAKPHQCVLYPHVPCESQTSVRNRKKRITAETGEPPVHLHPSVVHFVAEDLEV